MSPVVKYIVWTNLGVIAVLAFLYPQLVISPGPLVDGHKAFEKDCFACHTPLLGATDGSCISCHKIEEIGLKTSKGVPLAKPKLLVSFHQKLEGKACVGCHSDHQGLSIYRTMSRFAHDTLTKAELRQCESCHLKGIPTDELHNRSTQRCKNCHKTDKWKPAKKDKSHYMSLPFMTRPAPLRQRVRPAPVTRPQPVQRPNNTNSSNFRHEDMPRAERRFCVTCHKDHVPRDNTHRNAPDRCGRCHTTDQWVPLKPNPQY